MKEFVLIFRMDITSKHAQPTPEQMRGYMADWTEWIQSIAAQKRLADGGNHFLTSGRVLEPGGVLKEIPYTKSRESVAGYIIILAKDMEDATRIAEKCPILKGKKTSVEIRQAAVLQ